MYNYSKVRGKIREIYGTQEAFSKAIGLSTTTVSDKLNNKVEWTQSEIAKISNLIFINKDEIPVYFFNDEVQEIEPNKSEATHIQ